MRYLAAAVALALLAAPAAAAERRCAISAIEGGDAALWRDGVWSAAAPGPLPAGTALVLRTGTETRLEIACDDGLVVTVAPATEAGLEALVGPSGHGRDVVIQLIRGLLGIVAPSRTWRRLELRAPLAIAGARSTAWFGEVKPDGAVGFFVREGAVVVRPAGPVAFGPATLAPSEGVTIPPGGPAGPVVAWGAPRVEAARGALGFGWR